MTLELAAASGGIAVYDGEADGLRCVGIVGPDDAFTSWCGEPDRPTTLVADRGIEPVLVDLGTATGTVSWTVLPSGWTAASNGCSAPLATIIAAAQPGSRSVQSVVCAGNDAFVGIGASLFGPDLAPDGGGILVARGTEGWDAINFGTSIDCADPGDGVDRCEQFGVESELFEALLPMPPVEVLGESAFQVTSSTNALADIETLVGDATDPDEIASILAEGLADPEAEVAATLRRSGPVASGSVELMVVEVPQADDAFRFETWAVWVGLGDGATGVTDAFTWATCDRGVTGDGLCV